MPAGDAAPIGGTTRTTTTGLTPLRGRRSDSQSLPALGSPRDCPHSAQQLAPSTSASPAKPTNRRAQRSTTDPPPPSRLISAASDGLTAGAETPVIRPASSRRHRSSGAARRGSTERCRSYGGAASDPASNPATAQSSLGAPRRGGTTPLQGPGQFRSGTEGGPALAGACLPEVRRMGPVVAEN